MNKNGTIFFISETCNLFNAQIAFLNQEKLHKKVVFKFAVSNLIRSELAHEICPSFHSALPVHIYCICQYTKKQNQTGEPNGTN